MEYYLVIKKEWNLVTGDNLDGSRRIRLNEVSQRRTNTLFHLYLKSKKHNKATELD